MPHNNFLPFSYKPMVKFRIKGDIFTLSLTHCASEPYPAILLFPFYG
jgi:hypothetical protein